MDRGSGEHEFGNFFVVGKLQSPQGLGWVDDVSWRLVLLPPKRQLSIQDFQGRKRQAVHSTNLCKDLPCQRQAGGLLLTQMALDNKPKLCLLYAGGRQFSSNQIAHT